MNAMAPLKGTGRRLARLAVASALLVSLWVSLSSNPAFAAGESHPYLKISFGRNATEPFSNPNGIAIDEPTGDVYVADIGADEQQSASIEGGPSGGSFTLEFEGEKTVPLTITKGSNPGEALAPPAFEVEIALDALAKIGPGNISVSEVGALPGTVTYTFNFQGALASKNVTALTCDGSALSGGTAPTCAVATIKQGVEGSVYKFDSKGSPVDFGVLGTNRLTGTATSAGSFAFPDVDGNPAALAVDNSTDPSDPSRGDLYVMDAGHGMIDKFSPEGKVLDQITGFATAGSTGEHELLGLAADSGGDIRALTSPIANEKGENFHVDVFDDAALNAHIAAYHADSRIIIGQASSGFAVGPGDDGYVLDAQCDCSQKLGAGLYHLGRVDKAGSGDVAFAVDPATGHLYADDQSSVAEWDTGAMNESTRAEVAEGEEAIGSAVSSFGREQLSASAQQGGIAVNGTDGEIYVSNPAGGNVYVFGSDTPAVTIATTDVSQEAATLTGTVDPRGTAITSCEFEYGVTDEQNHGIYEHKVPCGPGAGAIGAGTAPVSVAAKIGGLRAGGLYQVRLVVTNADGTSHSSYMMATSGEPFGVKAFEVSFLNQDGTVDTQAGSHPHELLVNIEFTSDYLRAESDVDSPYRHEPTATIRDVTIDLPPGLVGNPNATREKCTLKQLDNESEDGPRGGAEDCPASSLLGTQEVEWMKGGTVHPGAVFHLYNMVPPRGVALQLGTNYVVPDLFINNGLLAGGNYPIQTKVIAVSPEAPVFKSVVKIFGVVGGGAAAKPFLTLPTGCHGPLHSSISVDSWQEPGHWITKDEVTRNSAGQPVSLTGCSKLRFPPEISVAPDSADASTSSGLAVGVKVPQSAAFNPNGLAESSLRDTTVALPAGVALNPAGADGLQSCTGDPGALLGGSLGSPGDQIGYEGFKEFNPEDEPGVDTASFSPEVPNPLQPGSNFCPDGSKIGTVKIKTPLLEHELEGAVYLASQEANPFGSLVAMYLVAGDPFSGSLIKLPGEVQLCSGPGQVIDGVTCAGAGQIVTTFKNTPDLPFEELQLHFFGGERAPLATPAQCGAYTTTAVFTPWDGNGPVTAESTFDIEHGPHGGPCPSAGLPFQPSLAAGSASNQAGGFSPFTMTMSRSDGQQTLQAVNLKMPPGLSGILTGVELCPEPQADQGLCGPNSLIGETTVSVGVGNDPFSVTGGKVYLTGPYRGAPFGLSIVNPAKAGPFDLEATAGKHPACDCLVVRAKIEVDPHTAALTVTSDNEGPYRIPTVIEGIPLEIQHVNVTINRQGFTFNPTDCDPTAIGGTLQSTEGASSQVSVPFQATNCGALGFAPKFGASTSGRPTRADGESLSVKLSYPDVGGHSVLASGLANIRQVKVELPKALPSRLTTLQKACTKAQFEADPAGCPAASVVGHAKATTPLLPVPLEGPAYFVSNGNESFPNLIVVLQGYGVTIDLVGDTFISKQGITSSTFKTVPDAPVGSFELNLPTGPYSALAATGNICKKAKSLVMPTEFVAQDGAQIHQQTKVAVTGCPKARRAVKHKKRRAKRHGKARGKQHRGG